MDNPKKGMLPPNAVGRLLTAQEVADELFCGHRSRRWVLDKVQAGRVRLGSKQHNPRVRKIWQQAARLEYYAVRGPWKRKRILLWIVVALILGLLGAWLIFR